MRREIILFIVIAILLFNACKKKNIFEDQIYEGPYEPCDYCWNILKKDHNEIYFVEFNEEHDYVLLTDTTVADTFTIDSVVWSTGLTYHAEDFVFPILDQAVFCTNQTGDFSVKVYLSSNISLPLSVESYFFHYGIYLNFEIPNSFSPNRDGLNDRLYVNTQGCNADFLFQVYSLKGKLLFETYDPYEGWDGKYKGKNVPIGTYKIYASNAYILDGKLNKYSETKEVQLIR